MIEPKMGAQRVKHEIVTVYGGNPAGMAQGLNSIRVWIAGSLPGMLVRLFKHAKKKNLKNWHLASLIDLHFNGATLIQCVNVTIWQRLVFIFGAPFDLQYLSHCQPLALALLFIFQMTSNLPWRKKLYPALLQVNMTTIISAKTPWTPAQATTGRPSERKLVRGSRFSSWSVCAKRLCRSDC